MKTPQELNLKYACACMGSCKEYGECGGKPDSILLKRLTYLKERHPNEFYKIIFNYLRLLEDKDEDA